MIDKSIRFSPSICLTHNCNLNCVYCYQNHDTSGKMSIDVAKSCIDKIFEIKPEYCEGIEIGFIGGEPLLEFELIKQIVEYTDTNYSGQDYHFFASTNGTLLDTEMKEWFYQRKNRFVLGLSLDGTPDTHNRNRCGSYDLIDIDFFVSTWPRQGVKMTLTEYSLEHLAENIKHIHSLGFQYVDGVNLFEGSFDWSNNRYLNILVAQLSELNDYYVQNDNLNINQMLNRHLDLCEETPHKRRKWCGIGTGTLFFDVDGKTRPCPFCTPMTFDPKTLAKLELTDFSDSDNFIDDHCLSNCYIYPICPYCAGANYFTEGTFKIRSKQKCKIQKLISLFAADLIGRRIAKNPDRFDEATLYHTINAIRNIRSKILPEFAEFIESLSSCDSN